MLEFENISTITSTMIIRLFQFIYKVSREISRKYSKTFQRSENVLADSHPPPHTGRGHTPGGKRGRCHPIT
jgi:hypothetical protein